MTKIEPKNANEATYNGDIPNTPIRFIWYVAKPFRPLMLLAFLAVVLAQVSELIAIWVVSELIDGFSTSTDKIEQIDILVFWGLCFVILGVLDRIFWRASGFLGLGWIIRADAYAYKQLYSYISNHSHGYFSNRFAGALSNKISNAAGGSSELSFRIMWDIFPEVISVTVTLILFFNLHWLVGTVFLGVLVLVFFFNLFWVKKRRPHVVAYSAASSALRGAGVDVLSNIAATRQYSRKSFELKNIDDVLSDRKNKDFKQAYMGEWLMVMNGVFGVLLTGMVLVIVYTMLVNDLATAGNLVLVLMLLARVGYTFNIMGNIMNGVTRKYGEIEEGLQEVLIDHEITDKKDAPILSVEAGSITWDKVVFEYGANKVFDDFNLKIEPGQRIGLVGPSGAGKTTFVSLLLRQHDIDAGEIMIDGQNIAQVTQDSLRSSIAVVPQEPMLFHRSIRENIAYGKLDATEEEIISVAKKAQAHDFISQLEEGYDTLVGERGVKLSGGQKQRVAIARAMLKDAPILVLDEATSALDSESEVAIQKALHELMVGKTVIAVAHRLSTLREMDRIIVLENGKIVEDGDHNSLAQAGGTYQRLWEHQAGGFLVE
ncbi:ABC transporter ATP-binding protein [Candidatus Kaiserbacteria bacterium]|nr:ABC transporter ATP-binding protein [Candidatus Kaiserbacteria bacterium]